MVVLAGRMTKAINVKYTAEGTAIGEFGLAVDGYKKGEPKDNQPVSFFNVVVFGKIVEAMAKYTSQGYKILVSGTLVQDRWKDSATGESRNKVKIIGNRVEMFLGKRDQSGQEASGEENQAPKSAYSAKAGSEEPYLSELDDNEIPF